MNRININKKARKKIAEICRDNDWLYCKIRLDGCMGQAHAPAHKHKRRWCYDKPDEMLWALDQWLPACTFCHNKIEFNKELTKKVFERNTNEF